MIETEASRAPVRMSYFEKASERPLVIRECTLASSSMTKLLEHRAHTLRAQVEAVRAQEVEGIHRMRVASRRLRASLAECKGIADKALRKRLGRQVRGITRGLGTARELDVSLDILTQHQAAQVHIPEHAFDYAIQTLRALRMEQTPRIFECAMRATSAAFEAALRELLDNLRPQKQCFIETAIVNQKVRYAALRKHYHEWQHAPSSNALHQIRIRLKKLRYASEVYAPLYNIEMMVHLAELKHLQSVLGSWNDNRILCQYLETVTPDAPANLHRSLVAYTASRNANVAVLQTRFTQLATSFFSAQRVHEINRFFEVVQAPCCRPHV